MKTFSIIIPTKNSPNLLSRLLASIPHRKDLEIIVVDDNSDPNIVDFSNYPGLNDNNTKVIFTKEGRGAGYARNIGLKNATGKWVLFSDSDDCFITDNLNFILNKYCNTEYDLVFCNIECIDISTNQISHNADSQYISFIESQNDDRIEQCRYNLRVPWGKMIRRDLIVSSGINFDETPVANDMMFSLKVGHHSSKTAIDTTKIYKWYIRAGSLTSMKSKETALIHFQKGIERNNFLDKCKMSKYRGSAFASIPNLIKCGVNPIKAHIMAFKSTPTKYTIRDFFKAIKLLINRH